MNPAFGSMDMIVSVRDHVCDPSVIDISWCVKSNVGLMNRRSILSLVFLALGIGSSPAAVVISGDFAAGTGSLSITAPMTFTITSAGTWRSVVFPGWAGTDGSVTTVLPTVGSSLEFQVGSNPTTTVQISALIDHRQSSVGAITAGDTTLSFGSVEVVVGDVITISPQTITFAATSGFNAALTGTYSGSPILASTGAVDLTAQVPEPSAALLVAIASVGLLRRRR